MAFKINISAKNGKTYKIEADASSLKGKSLGEIIKGQEISPDLAGYELQITGASDKAGITAMENVQGVGLKKVLLTYGKGMHKRPKGDKKINKSPPGLRLRKSVRGKVISEAISQINTKVIKEGSKPLKEIFSDQNKSENEAKGESKGEEEKKEETKEQEPEKTEKQESNPGEEPKEKPSTEGNPDKEPKESEKAEKEKANPDEEPKQ
ncbi:hypothetical protein GF378_03210 [Candidatus Pacearchaeota archaeon]|nr:hypothetical protein [Candidatus Pacearchaeota archaeon]